jgi:hypothetical protein
MHLLDTSRRRHRYEGSKAPRNSGPPRSPALLRAQGCLLCTAPLTTTIGLCCVTNASLDYNALLGSYPTSLDVVYDRSFGEPMAYIEIPLLSRRKSRTRYFARGCYWQHSRITHHVVASPLGGLAAFNRSSQNNRTTWATPDSHTPQFCRRITTQYRSEGRKDPSLLANNSLCRAQLHNLTECCCHDDSL